MTLEELKKLFESLTHGDRVRRMVVLGTQAESDAQITKLLNTLEQGDFSDRIMALQSCYGSYDGARALRAFTDASRGVRSLAVRLLPCCEFQ